MLGLAACKDPSQPEKRFRLLSSQQTGIDFSNNIDAEKVNILDYVNMYNGSGVGIGDFNKDGFEDVFFGGNLVSSRLYLNNATAGNISFSDVTVEAGLTTNVWVNGITIIDINQDGWEDIYCSVSAGKSSKQRTNKLFVNQGLNEAGTPIFEEKAASYGLADDSHTIQTAFFDYDGDQDLDVFMIANYPTGYLDAEANRIVNIKKKGNRDRTDRLYRNDGIGADGHPIFTDVSETAGITLEGFSLGLAVHDFNEDGNPDVYVANDYVTNDLLYINNGDGTFANRIKEFVEHTSYSSMGVDIADINNDGLQDIIVMDMLPEADKDVKLMYSAAAHNSFELMQKMQYNDQYFRNTLQLNNGMVDSIPVPFSEIGQMAKVQATHWSWSALMPDLDLDGWRDIFITNGFAKDVNNLDFINYEQPTTFVPEKFDGESYVTSLKDQKGIYIPNYLFKNRKNLEFEDVGEEWGITDPSFSNGCAYADFDNDGDLDLVTNNLNDVAFIYENTTLAKNRNKHHFLQLVLRDTAPNRNAIGATIQVKTSQGVVSQVVQRTRGFMSSVGSVWTLGLGSDSIIENVEVAWPDGQIQRLVAVAADQRLVIEKNISSNSVQDQNANVRPYHFHSKQIPGLRHRHQERYFNDFNYQRLLPHKLSMLGPSIAVGDVDNNEWDDFYIAGAHGSAGMLYLQGGKGGFEPRQIEDTLLYEDQGSLLLDIDNDKDLDLYVVSGGVERGKRSSYYSDRLLINQGKGTFGKQVLGFSRENGSCVVAADYDRDGDLDLFVGGASKPGEYPLPAQSQLLQNDTESPDHPVLTDVTSIKAHELATIGIVRSALWSDYDNDGWVDLFVVGEYMPITLFKNVNGTLVKQNNLGIEGSKGMWNSINGADLDNDGDIDYVLGNRGLNSIYQPTKEHPITIYAADFDANGILDPVMTKWVEDKEVPVHLRDDLFGQLISLKKTMLKYEEYAAAEITDLFSKKSLEEAYVSKWEYAQSSCLMNEGDGTFTMVPLPKRAQLAPIYGVLIDDFDEDNIPDILTVGNSHAQEVFTGWHDASVGLLLKGQGDGTFVPVPPRESNFMVSGDGKALARFRSPKNERVYIASVNNDSLRTFRQSLMKEAKWVALAPTDHKVKITYSDGTVRIKEYYYGEGYYSQTDRFLHLSTDIQKVEIVNYSGVLREVFSRAD